MTYYKHMKNNNIDIQYTDLLTDIIANGNTRGDRTGTGTVSVFGRMLEHDMSLGFPLLTTKQLHHRQMLDELRWLMSGDTNIVSMLRNKNYIWVGDAYKAYVKATKKTADMKWLNGHFENISKDEFIQRILDDKAFALKYGDLGPVYPAQWRRIFDGVEMIDQLQEAVNKLDNTQNLYECRRIIVNSWNVAQIRQMTLPPCHYSFQLYAQPNGDGKLRVDLAWNQRSVDTALGLPFNIASYGTLLEVLCAMTNNVPGRLIAFMGDTHLYLDHTELAAMQAEREHHDLCKIVIPEEIYGNTDIDDVVRHIHKIKYVGYTHEPKINYPLSN